MPDEDIPPALRPDQNRDVVFTARARTLEKFRKVAETAGPHETYTIECDEGRGLGGDNTAPTPLAYFTSALAF